MKLWNFLKNKDDKTVEKGSKIALKELFNYQITNLDGDETLQSCLKFRCEALAKMPIKLIQKNIDGTTEVNNNLYNLLFSRPNKNQDATSFWYSVEKDRLLKGTSYIKINRINGMVTSLVKLNYNLVVAPVIVNDLDITKEMIYLYKGMEISSEDLLIFKNGVSKYNILKGESCLTALKNILESNINGTQSIKNINKNGINAAVKVSVQDTIKEDKKAAIIYNALKNARGYASKGVILEENGVKITPFEVDLKATQYLEIYKANQCSIITYFGLVAGMMNIEQSTGSYSNSADNYLGFLKNTMLYNMETYINELNYKLLTPIQIKRGKTFNFDTENVLKVDYKTLVDSTSNLVKNSIITINEGRAKTGYGNRADSDKIIVNGAYVDLDDLGLAIKNKIPLKGGENDEN